MDEGQTQKEGKKARKQREMLTWRTERKQIIKDLMKQTTIGTKYRHKRKK
jgi:hypothetical protein